MSNSRRYAAQTTVSAEKSKSEIELILVRYGATSFATFSNAAMSMIIFEANGRRVKFVLPMPVKNDYTVTGKGRSRTVAVSTKAYDQEVRRRWRALALAIKAKLESVASGIATFEDEFMAQIMLPDNSTVGEVMQPQIAQAYATGKMPPLLQLGSGE